MLAKANPRRLGVILILVGLGLPIILLPFAEGYYPRQGFVYSLSTMHLAFWEYERPYEPPPPGLTKTERDIWLLNKSVAESLGGRPHKIVIHYKYPFALGMTLVFIGAGILVLRSPKHSP